MEKSIVYSKHKGARTSVKKSNPVMALIRGKDVTEAIRVLEFDKTKASKLILKVLESAVANARHNLKLNEKDLYVSEAYVNEGETIKRIRIVAHSRTSPIFKRTAHLVIGLNERKNS